MPFLGIFRTSGLVWKICHRYFKRNQIRRDHHFFFCFCTRLPYRLRRSAVSAVGRSVRCREFSAGRSFASSRHWPLLTPPPNAAAPPSTISAALIYSVTIATSRMEGTPTSSTSAESALRHTVPDAPSTWEFSFPIAPRTPYLSTVSTNPAEGTAPSTSALTARLPTPFA